VIPARPPYLGAGARCLQGVSWESMRGAARLALNLPRNLTAQACCAAPADVAGDNTRCPVVLVHGYAGSDAVWRPLRAALAHAGFGHVVRFRYNALTAHPTAVAHRLAEHALAAVSETGAPGVHLVGHSLGGVLLRAAVASSPVLANRVLGAVTISSPHRGVALARLAPGPCARWMQPGAERDTASGRSVRWLSYWSDRDRVVPPSSAWLFGDARNEFIPGCGHLGICRDRRLLRSVVGELVARELELDPVAALRVLPAPLAA
jgi:triacylglycerol lipase